MATGRTTSSVPTAQRLIERGDVAGYLALFSAAAELSTHERYRTRRDLAQAAIDAAGRDTPEQARPLQLAATRELLTLLEQEPREPVLLSQAGALLRLLSSCGAAQALFEAALRLDGSLTAAADGLAATIGRRRVPQQADPAVLGELAPRALRVAERAHPAAGKTLSLCMIVKDEEEMLPRCLAAAAPAVDEIVLVDTGSSDRTVEIAESFGARVLRFPWTGSFSEARNVGLDAASCDWMLVLDADEVLVADDVAQLRAALGQTWREAFYVSEINHTGELDEGSSTTHTTLRLFRTRPEYRYSGRLHEQILDKLPAKLPERIATAPVRIEHFGYLGAVRDAKEKSRRNLELLERQRDEGDDSAFMHFNIGAEYFSLGAVERALAEFERSAELLAAEPDGGSGGYLPALARRHVTTLRACGREQDAIALAERQLERYPDFTDLVFEQAGALYSLGRVEEAIARYERCLELGDASSSYSATLGAGSYRPTIALAEIALERGDGAHALALLDAGLAEFPGFQGLVLPYATALLATGAPADVVVAQVEQRVEAVTATIRFMLGTALIERGEVSAAAAQFERVVEQQPGSARGRIALADALLSMRGWDAAATAAAGVPDADPLAPTARRSELFARLAGGDLDGAAAILARGAELQEGDRELFSAWLAAARGERDATPLPAAAVKLLDVILEALLRVQEVELFGLLAPLLERTPVAPRVRRELLAGMYLRRGFLASAAEEWLTVCEREPDVPALLGLAQVAAAQGMTEEALDFAREARSLDPENADAARALARLEPLAA
ncbi:glycosyltransferase [Conexibacter sp. JD483]|uniref:TPR domain-containing glycosyltransferase n=1 Tax=unclassified Conexibacter TaxID=2627773 RepID=UPI00271A648A|nr:MULTISPECIES: TPR domain-containing glycosyltransferase [unclassified Conexibacter]MDO8184476.1 glycosyltransferase [Conexibacter sp. CPCC 205706]MDO8197782.1 glycosyltransferase [Conexibacter sp. CPCC 205762]MDR9368082.1 glycosyltransferase [Conexibacter sp. JD483]